jgi:hypothetical protein
MRSLMLSLSPKLQKFYITLATIFFAFIIANISRQFFNAEDLARNTDLITSTYQVLGTIYAILITFTLWSVWQNYAKADEAVQNEAYTLLDLVHILESCDNWKKSNIRAIAFSYTNEVLHQEWPMLRSVSNKTIITSLSCRKKAMEVIRCVQIIVPNGEREDALYSQALTLLSNWLDARRTRVLIAKGNSANALWPLLLTGALVLFACHGLFVVRNEGIWNMLLAGFSVVIGITFYLIFTFDSPFSGSPSIGSEPFELAANYLMNPL